jgi:hypothetical protein
VRDGGSPSPEEWEHDRRQPPPRRMTPCRAHRRSPPAPSARQDPRRPGLGGHQGQAAAPGRDRGGHHGPLARSVPRGWAVRPGRAGCRAGSPWCIGGAARRARVLRRGVDLALATGASDDDVVETLTIVARTVGLARVVSAAPDLALAPRLRHRPRARDARRPSRRPQLTTGSCRRRRVPTQRRCRRLGRRCDRLHHVDGGSPTRASVDRARSCG